MNYVEVEVEFTELRPWKDILLSVMAENGFESFVETKRGLKAYIPENVFFLDDLMEKYKIDSVSSISYNIIKDRNWNAKWEENFEPVHVDKDVVIRAPFHKQTFNANLILTIQPQMSFGTGHHQTTWLMTKQLYQMELDGLDVLDMGTGTGVLAILAEKRGAASVFAADIDEWSFRNAKENVLLNDCCKIEVILGDHGTIEGKNFDLILANINKNILIEHFSVYSKRIHPKGKLLISGFFETDQDDLIEAGTKYGFIFEQTCTRDGWALMEFHA